MLFSIVFLRTYSCFKKKTIGKHTYEMQFLSLILRKGRKYISSTSLLFNKINKEKKKEKKRHLNSEFP